jgi:(R,R)-butanediol dehydrogenase / meso-butanediol dehydrogenase / diacetyl reductase
VKAIVWNGPEEMAVEQVPEPVVEPGMVILRPEATGICGSEVEGYLGKMDNRTPPLVMGHEFAGTVTEVGEEVDRDLIGREVAVNPLSSDGTCRLCHAGYTNLCPNRTLIGIHSPGGFAEYVLAPHQNVYPLPDDAGPRIGALAEPLANGVHAVRLGLVGDAVERAIVIGAGTIGLMCLQAAVLDELPEVAVVEPHEARREQALGLGAHTTYATGTEAREAFDGATEGLGIDLVIDAVGAEATRRMAVEELVRPGGRAVMVGLHDDATTLGFHDVVRGQLAIQGSYAYTAEDYEQALRWLVEGRAGIGELPPVLPLERGPDAFAELVRGPSAQIKVFLSGSAG